MKHTLPALAATLAFTACSGIAEPLPEAIWIISDTDRNGVTKAVVFNGETDNGTETALLFECLEDSPSLRLQHGQIDDDDLTWEARGTKERTTITYSLDNGPETETPVFLIGLDGSKLSFTADNEAEIMSQMIAATRVTFDIAPATFDRPDTAVTVTFNLTDAKTEIGDHLSMCEIS
ncbi:MAG: hypothetical protein AAFR74_09000 [Pseudomonadota bacterium]